VEVLKSTFVTSGSLESQPSKHVTQGGNHPKHGFHLCKLQTASEPRNSNDVLRVLVERRISFAKIDPLKLFATKETHCRQLNSKTKFGSGNGKDFILKKNSFIIKRELENDELE
jgi:hypothetical protein